ncbi:ATP-grasp fold amidoligase family protein [Ornithinimicrobium sp. Y1847]|uniref:ATP-grasp fold amidoligase family protein n=1 Tax=Ornithinimicrobium sp. Y1847 TaxID=3405419 RepID=UPI003B673885
MGTEKASGTPRQAGPLGLAARRTLRSFPPVARREAKLDRLLLERSELRGQLGALRDQVSVQDDQIRHLEAEFQRLGAEVAFEDRLVERLRRPSFTTRYASYRRDVARVWRAGGGDVREGMNRKLAMYRFAESHGVRVPQVLGGWQTPDEIDWASLPNRFVLKSDGGAASNGVFPLERVGDSFRTVGGSTQRQPSFYRGKLRSRLRADAICPPFFVEEFLDTGIPGRLPVDIKIYAFFGQVGHVLLRDMGRHGDRATARWRYLDAAGADLGPVSLTNPAGPDVPVPDRLAEMVAIAERLSRAVPLPFVRIDLYDLPESIFFGEVTMMPGGPQRYTPEHDEILGRHWEDAARRLATELRSGRKYGLLHGDHPVRTPAEESLDGIPGGSS